MRIAIDTTILAATGVNGPGRIQVDGSTINEPIDLIRALTRQFANRGGDSVAFSFQVAWQFNSCEEAESWLLGVWGLLPKQGDVTYDIGSGYNTFYQRDAVLERGGYRQEGLTVIAAYTILGEPPQSSNPPSVVPDLDATEPTPVIQYATGNIASGVETVDVTFSTAFGAAPTVIPAIKVPEGEPQIEVQIVKGSITTTGFSVQLSAETPSANYQLSYIAVAAS